MASATVTARDLIATLSEARQTTLGLIADLADEQLIGPKLAIVNPLLWEIGHVAWFQEHWALRHLRGLTPDLVKGDALYNSSKVAHAARWDLPLPARKETLDYMRRVLERVVGLLESQRGRELSRDEVYFHRLALFHEDMHGEAIAYTRQTLGYPAPRLRHSHGVTSSADGGGRLAGEVEIPGGVFGLGATPDQAFVFDNEKWRHAVTVAPFAMARAAVSNAEFAAFVDDRGYERREVWSDAGWAWRERAEAGHPVYWYLGAGRRWFQRVYNAVVPLAEDLPVMHVNWYEADAYCRWAKRRLPSEAEWELAAAAEPAPDGHGISHAERRFPWGAAAPDARTANLDGAAGGLVDTGALAAGDSAFGVRQMAGNVWEWTADDFAPYPGFVADPYEDYSQPWFHTHKVLRGGCWFTRSRLIRNTWRNFYTPDRRDVWCGFRTARSL